uniref:Protein kinase domain-containing protein n=1 Tax=Strongyloides stercoralis TaxID=6248 RepID=A0A0K0ELT8_STRER
MDRIKKKACELFVPIVKDGRDCSVCGLSLLQHSLVLPKQNIETDFGTDKSNISDFTYSFHNNLLEKNYSSHISDLCYNSENNILLSNKMKNDLIPSTNSAFSEYRKLPLYSPTKKNINSTSSPVKLSHSSYKVPETIISVNNTEIIKPKPVHQRKSFAYGEIVPSSMDFSSINSSNNNLSSSQSINRQNISTLNNKEHKENIQRSKNFKDILSRFQNASDNFNRQYSLRYPSSTSGAILQNINVTIPSTIISGSNTVSGRRSRTTRRNTLGISKISTSNSSSNLQHYYQPSFLIENNDKREVEDKDDNISITEDNKITLPNYNNNIHRHRELDISLYKEEQQNQNLLSPTTTYHNNNSSQNIFESVNSVNFVNSMRANSVTSIRNPLSPIDGTISKRRNNYIKNYSPKLNISEPCYSPNFHTYTPSEADSTISKRSSSQQLSSSRNLSLSSPHTNSLQTKKTTSKYLRSNTPNIENNDMKISPIPSQRIASRPPSTNRLGSDSGCIRENSSSVCVSPRSPDYRGTEINLRKNFTEKEAYNEIISNQATTLAMVAENFNEISSNCYPEQRIISKEFLNKLNFYQINFKYTSPIIIKGSIIISDAEIGTGYGGNDVRVSVMISPAAHYSPLMGRQAQVSGFGPVILTEFEENSNNMSNFLNNCGIYKKNYTNYKITIMPSQICCSFHTLSAQFLHHSSNSINPTKYEEHVCFIMLQLLSALKYLQSDGVERLSTNFKEFLITYHHSDLQICLQTFEYLPRLFLLKEAIDVNEDENQNVGMCKYAMRALYTLLNHKMHTIPEIIERSEFSFPLKKCAELLSMDKSSSLSEAKSVLEMAFFVGPTKFIRESEAKIWLDINRAHLLNRVLGIILTKNENFLDLKEKMHIQFLLSSTPKSLCQSLKILSNGSLRNISNIQDSEC